MSIELAKRLLQIEHEKGGRLGEDGQLYYRVPESVFSMARNAVQSDQPDESCQSRFDLEYLKRFGHKPERTTQQTEYTQYDKMYVQARWEGFSAAWEILCKN